MMSRLVQIHIFSKIRAKICQNDESYFLWMKMKIEMQTQCTYLVDIRLIFFNILRELLLGDSKIIRLILRSYLRHSTKRETWIPLKYLFNWFFNPLILLHRKRYDKEENRAHSWINRLNQPYYIHFVVLWAVITFVWKRTKPQLKFLPSRYLRVFEYSIRLDTINQ